MKIKNISDKKGLSKYIDHTLLKSDATKAEIVNLCKEAIKYNFKSVCVNPSYVKLAKLLLKNSNVLVCTVVGFPLGANTEETKVFEATNVVKLGADEIDMVANISKIVIGDFEYIENEISAVRKAIGKKLLKVIIETSQLTKIQIDHVSRIALKAGADYIKTSTGFSKSGAKVEDVILMKAAVGGKIKVKASGGIRTLDDFQKMIDAGASRIGTSSGINILISSEGKILKEDSKDSNNKKGY